MRSRKLDIMMISLIYFFVLSIFFAIPILDFNSTLTSFVRIGFFSIIWLYFLRHFIKCKGVKIDKKVVIFLIAFFILQVLILVFNDGLGGINKTNLSLMIYPLLCMTLYLVFNGDYALEDNKLLIFCRVITAFALYACLYNLIFNFDTFKNIFALKSSYDLQFTAFFKNRNTFAVLLLLGLYANTIGLLKDSKYKKIWIISLVIILFNLFFTFSRSSILAAGIFVIVLILASKDLRKKVFKNKKIVFAILGLLAIVLLIPYTRNYILDNVVRLKAGVTNRNSIFDYCIDYIKTHNYIIGNGYIKPYAEFAKHFIYIGFHNSFITVLMCQGIIGLILYLMLLGYSLVNSIKLKKYSDLYGSIFIAVFISIIIYSFFESRVLFTLEFIDYTFTLFVTIIPLYLLNKYRNNEDYKFNKTVKQDDLISVIVPVYNVSKYLNKSLNSIKNQTYSNIEVIIVNDGSTDNSKDICESFVEKDKRFKLYNKKNGGLCSARNYGYRKSNGKYIYFFDSDDYLDADIIKVLHDLMVSNKTDLSMVGYYFTYNNYETPNEHGNNMKYNLTKNDLLNNIIIRGSYGGYVWNKLYKRELIGNLEFDEKITYREDMLFNSSYIQNINSGVYYTKAYYHYVQRDGSLVHQNGFNSKMMGHLYSLEQMRDSYMKEKIDSLRVEYELLKCCYNFKYRISISKEDYAKETKIIDEFTTKYYRIFMNNENLKAIKKIEIYLTNKYPVFICMIKTKLSDVKRFLYE